MKKLLQLLRDNAKNGVTLRVESKDDEATIYLYDVIDDYWGIGAEAFVKALNALTAKVIHLRINSPGGDVFAARAMVAAIRAHPSKIISHVDGLAASAASFVAIAADDVEMNKGSFFMIHKAWTLAFGNADDFVAMAALLEKVDGTIVADYQRKTKKSAEELQQLMADETWYTADEAKDAGFADRVFEGEQPQDRWNLAAYGDKAPKLSASDSIDKELRAAREQRDRRLTLLEKCPA